MLKFIVVALLLLVPISTVADIYRQEDEEGVVHFTDAPKSDGWKVFAPSVKKPSAKNKKPVPKAPAPIPGKYIYREVSASDGTIYAVKQTNVKGVYYWYLGPYGNYRALCKKGTILLDDGAARVNVQNGEVVFETVLSKSVWLDGTVGYQMYEITVGHAASH